VKFWDASAIVPLLITEISMRPPGGHGDTVNFASQTCGDPRSYEHGNPVAFVARDRVHACQTILGQAQRLLPAPPSPPRYGRVDQVPPLAIDRSAETQDRS
jgi:hypothetical protein